MLKSSCALVSRIVVGSVVALGAFALGMGDAKAVPSEVEVATPPSLCEPGYREGIFGCDDINECWEGTDDCSDDAACVNRMGSFTCHCNEGFEGDGVTCKITAPAVTEPVDECASAADCEPNMACVTDDGPAYCACKPGYREGIYGCDDINECWEGTDDCSDGATCVNRMGSFSCRTVSTTRVRSAVLSTRGLSTARQALSEDEDDDADAVTDGGAMCSAGAMGGTDPSAVAMVMMAAAVLVSRRRKG